MQENRRAGCSFRFPAGVSVIPPSLLPDTISRLVRAFGVLRHLGPIFREEQPRFLIERVYCLHGSPMTLIGMPSKARNVFL